MRHRVRLTEGDLHRIIRESINTVLTEFRYDKYDYKAEREKEKMVFQKVYDIAKEIERETTNVLSSYFDTFSCKIKELPGVCLGTYDLIIKLPKYEFDKKFDIPFEEFAEQIATPIAQKINADDVIIRPFNNPLLLDKRNVLYGEYIIPKTIGANIKLFITLNYAPLKKLAVTM